MEKDHYKLAIRRLSFFVNLATANRSAIGCEDVLLLLPKEVQSCEQIKQLVSEKLQNISILDGYLIKRGHEALVALTLKKKKESLTKISYAKLFVREHPTLFKHALAVAVSGSTSYMSSTIKEDLDLFIVTKNHTMWSTLFRLYIYLRVRKALSFVLGQIPEYCLSIVFTEKGVKSFLKKSKSALTARELISLYPLKGEEYLMYIRSLCPWISEYYPKIHTNTKSFKESATSATLFETLSYAFLSVYVKFKAKIKNYLIEKRGHQIDVFDTICSKDMLIYESRRYKLLKKLYDSEFESMASGNLGSTQAEAFDALT